MDRGQGRMNYGDRGNYRVQLRAVTEAGWNGTGRNGPYRLAALACLGRGGKVLGWKVLEGWTTMTDHLGRYMHTHLHSTARQYAADFQGRWFYYSI